ncbi:MAG: S8 family serine peptidase [Alphaproteobacteria bacterium]|nr:S8 family serine peptidase [Alphaproteobacteria bacterium]
MLKKPLKTLAAIFMFSFIVSSSLEGRVHARPQSSSVKKKTPTGLVLTKNLSSQKKKQVVVQKRPQRPLVAKRPQARKTLAAKRPPTRKLAATQKAPQTTTRVNKRQVAAKKTPPRTVVRARSQANQTALQRKRNLPTKTTPNRRPRQTANPKAQLQPQQKTSLAQKRQSSQPAFKGNPPRQTPLVTKTPVNRTSANRNTPRKTDYLSLLPFHNRENAKAGGLDKLLAKDMNGGGQTVAVIELSGEWKPLKEAMNGKAGFLSPQLKANYKANFLTPIGGPDLHPEEKNDWLRDRDRIDGGDSSYHGSSVSSVILDFVPQAKILPVSTYLCRHTDRFYDTADALMDLSRRSDVSIINMSSGYTKSTSYLKTEYKPDGTEIDLFKRIYNPKLAEAFKAIAKAGKVVVIAAGNEGKPIDTPQFWPSGKRGVKELVGQLMQELDAGTRQSIIVVGSCDPDTRTITPYSNKPGLLKNIQESFLLAPGNHVTNFAKKDDMAIGTSFAAPYVCAAIANLASKRNITPKRAVQALKETAERRPDVRTYGRGIIRADKALEYLERAY